VIRRQRVRAFRPIREAEADIRRRIEFGTFLGKAQKDPHTETVRKLLSLKPGQKAKGIVDVPQLKYRYARFTRDAFAMDKNFALAFGKTAVTSTVTFDATHYGDRIHIKGTVTHEWDDEYDFDREGQPGHKQATILEKAKLAKPFDIAAEWTQDVEGWVEIRDGRLTNPRFTWTDKNE